MQKKLDTQKGFIEYTLKVRIEETDNGYVCKLFRADGSVRTYGYYQDTLLDAQESAVYLLKTEAEKLLKMVQEKNS